MNIKLHISHQFIHDDADKQFTFGEGVVNAITAHAGEFPNLPHTVVVLGAVNDLLHSTYLTFLANGESAKGNFINAEYDWKLKFTHTAVYADYVANGNQAIIDHSGFVSTASNSTPTQHLGPLVDFKSHGNSVSGAGVVSSSVKGLTGLRAYLFTMQHKDATMTVVGNQVNITMAGVIVFSFLLNTTASVDFSGMASLTKMMAQAAGFNTAGIGDFSQAVEVSIP